MKLKATVRIDTAWQLYREGVKPQSYLVQHTCVKKIAAVDVAMLSRPGQGDKDEPDCSMVFTFVGGGCYVCMGKDLTVIVEPDGLRPVDPGADEQVTPAEVEEAFSRAEQCSGAIESQVKDALETAPYEEEEAYRTAVLFWSITREVLAKARDRAATAKAFPRSYLKKKG